MIMLALTPYNIILINKTNKWVYLQGIVEKGCKTVLHVGLNDVSVKGVIHTHLGSVSHGILGEDGDFGGSVRNNRVVPKQIKILTICKGQLIRYN